MIAVLFSLVMASWNCDGLYHPLLWGDGITEVPVRPYCWSPMRKWVPWDLDFNGVVQAEAEGDGGWFGECHSGPNVPYRTELNGVSLQCGMCDTDHDGDVDLDDFGDFQRHVQWEFAP